MKVYDCFTFYNEFRLLELRLEELWDHVDYFIIAESNKTHQNKHKDFNLLERWDDFSKYHEKIRYLKIMDMPEGDSYEDGWIREEYQRRSLKLGLFDSQPDDLIIIGDADEIVRPKSIEYARYDPFQHKRYIPLLPCFQFKLNYLMVNPVGYHGKSVMVRAKYFTDPQTERAYTFPWTPGYMNPDLDWYFLPHGGWHFSSLGREDFIKNKLSNYAHSEFNTPEVVENLSINDMIRFGVGIHGFKYDEHFIPVSLGSYMPKYVLHNLKKWHDLIIPYASHSVYDFYPNFEINYQNLNHYVDIENGIFKKLYKELYLTKGNL